jgi:hypothetical protein
LGLSSIPHTPERSGCACSGCLASSRSTSPRSRILVQRERTAYDPIAIFGTWKSATEGAGNVGTPAMADPMANKWNLTSSADALPAAAMACNQGFGAELRFEVGLISGHSYRLQVIAHDGDQNKGGDSGEDCAIFCAGSGSLCDPGVPLCGEADAAQCPAGKVCVQGCYLSGTQ